MKKALLIIDLQKDFIDEVVNKNQVIIRTKKLINFFKKNNHLVIFIQDFHFSKKDKEFEKWGCHALIGTKGVDYIDQCKPAKNDLIVKKRRYSAFFKTNLDKILRKNKISQIFICGLYTDFCVLTTAIEAYMRDFDVFVVADATGTTNFANHQRTLKQIKILAAKEIVMTEDILKSKV